VLPRHKRARHPEHCAGDADAQPVQPQCTTLVQLTAMSSPNSSETMMLPPCLLMLCIPCTQEGFKAEMSRQVQKLIWVASRSSYSHTYSARAGDAGVTLGSLHQAAECCLRQTSTTRFTLISTWRLVIRCTIAIHQQP